MDLKILDGRKVAHKVFGVGKIVDADERLISIDFGGCIKKFDFRSVEKFINFENDETKQSFDSAIHELLAAEEALEIVQREEELRKIEEEKRKKEEAENLLKEKSAALKKDKGLEIKDGVLIGLGTNTKASIVIPDHVTSIGKNAFNNRYDVIMGFKNITIPDSVTQISENAFEGCIIEKLTIGKGVEKIDFCAFDYCRIDKVNYMGNIDTWAEIKFFDYYSNPLHNAGDFYIKNKLVTDLALSEKTKRNDIAFVVGGSIKNITVDVNNPNYKSIDGNLYSKDEKTLIKYAAGKKETEFIIPDSVTDIAIDGFAGAESLTSLTIGNNVKYIGPATFCGCSSLKTVNYLGTIDEWAEIFYSCNTERSSAGPLSIYIDGKLVVDAVITKAEYIGRYTFRNCNSLKSVKISGDVKGIGEAAFLGCKNLESLEISGKVEVIENNAFANCYSLKNVILHEGITTIEYDAFYHCDSLESIVIPESVTSITKNTFDGCESLTNIIVSENNPCYKSVDGHLYTKDGQKLF